jgi:very-short-patch-repair endonuclease
MASAPEELGLRCDIASAGESVSHRGWQGITAIAANQHGLITSSQAIELTSKITVARLVDWYRLIGFRYGVYLIAGVPRTEWQPLMAACLAIAPHVAASHRSAALLHEFPAVAPPPDPEITVYGQCSRRLDDVVGHRSEFLHEDDLTVVRNIPTTAPARTIVDMGRYLTTYLQVRIMDRAKRRELCTYEEVAACLERIGGRGRPGSGRLKRVVARRLSGIDAGDSQLEVITAEAMVAGGLPPFVQQHPVEVEGHTYFIDLAWPKWKVGIEVMGDVHLDPLVADNDADRRNLLRRAGWDLYDARYNTNLHRLAGLVLGAISTRQVRRNRTRDED